MRTESLKGGRPDWEATDELRTSSRVWSYWHDQECLRGVCEKQWDRNENGGEAKGSQDGGTGELRRIGVRLVGLVPSRGDHS